MFVLGQSVNLDLIHIIRLVVVIRKNSESLW